MSLKFNFRQFMMIGGLLSLVILGGAYGLEVFLHLEPCGLCVLQRFVLWGISLFFWMGALHNPKAFVRLFYCIGALVFSLMGVLLSSRHLWLQYAPAEEVSNCLAGFEQLFAFKPWYEVIKELFTASPECSKIDFTFLNTSLPGWSLMAFICFALFSLIIGWLQIKRRI